MSFEKTCDGYEMWCNSCPEIFRVESHNETQEDFMDAIFWAKDAGWKCFKKNGRWKHRCPRCKAKEIS